MPGHPLSPVRLPQRLVVRGVNWLGDSVMTTPALQRLREFLPEAHIALLTPQKLADLWLHHPSVNAVQGFLPGEGPWGVARRLRAGHFDAALILPNSPRSALEVWLAGIPERTGYARAWRNWFLTRAVAPRPARASMRKRSVKEIHRLVGGGAARAAGGFRVSGESVPAERGGTSTTGMERQTAHQSYEYLHLAAALGASPEPLPPSLVTLPEELQAVRSKFGLEPQAQASGPLLGLNAGAEYGPAKRWPTDRFVTAAREIQARTGCRWLLLGGASDGPLAEEIHSALSKPGLEVHNLAGKTSLRELMAVLKLCRVLLSNDSGPMHVAAALGTPVVVPFGSTSSKLTGPGLPGDARHHLLHAKADCAPCFRRTCPIDFRCMTGIAVERVVASVLEAVRSGG